MATDILHYSYSLQKLNTWGNSSCAGYHGLLWIIRLLYRVPMNWINSVNQMECMHELWNRSFYKDVQVATFAEKCTAAEHWNIKYDITLLRYKPLIQWLFSRIKLLLFCRKLKMILVSELELPVSVWGNHSPHLYMNSYTMPMVEGIFHNIVSDMCF